MKYSNKYNLPAPFVRAVENDPYDKGDSDFSATSLAEPPRAQVLKEQFKDVLEVDVCTRVAAIIGQGTHSIAERARRPGIDIVENRYFAIFVVDGFEYKVSAQIDLYEGDTFALWDWKTTKAFAFSKKAGSGQKPEWISQMNIGTEIMRRNHLTVKSNGIIALLKDWNKREAGTSGMPLTEVVSVDLPIWERDKTTVHIEERIRLHVAARTILPKCNSTESWGGRKCADWCDANSVCKQYQDSKKTGLLNDQ